MTRSLVCCAVLLLAAAPMQAQQRYALIVSGATGGSEYATQYAKWTDGLSRTLVDQMKLEPARLTVLSESAEGAAASTAANLRRSLQSMAKQLAPADLLLVVLIGHGTFDGVDAKFNLVGPDLESAEWASLFRAIPGRLVIVNASSASFPFLERLAAPRRIVISATDSAAQRFDTVFPEYFIGAFRDDAADIDKNGRVSIWEAFAAASGRVRQHYQQRGQLSTERALLDDTGDGIGREAAAQGDDGALASRTYLDAADAGAPPTDEILVDLLQRRASLSAEIEELQIKKAFLSADEYAREFERVMLALARITRDIKARTKS